MTRSGATATSEKDNGKEAKTDGTSKQKTVMSPEHKKALAEGREDGRIVREYLDALEEHKPKRGRKASPESIKERIAKVDADLVTATPFERLTLTQKKMDLEEQLARTQETTNIAELQEKFVKVAKPYAERRGITPTAFRKVGVPANVLQDAGLVERRAS